MSTSVKTKNIFGILLLVIVGLIILYGIIGPVFILFNDSVETLFGSRETIELPSSITVAEYLSYKKSGYDLPLVYNLYGTIDMTVLEKLPSDTEVLFYSNRDNYKRTFRISRSIPARHPLTFKKIFIYITVFLISCGIVFGLYKSGIIKAIIKGLENDQRQSFFPSGDEK